MSDFITDFRYALRNALFNEAVHPQSTVIFEVTPGEKPKWASAPSETHLRIVGLDRAVSRGNKGFLGREWFCPSHPSQAVSDRDHEGKDKTGDIVNTPQTTCPTCNAQLMERPRRQAGSVGAPEELGAWHVVGLPAQTATGYKGKGSDFPGPEPWVVFMDWMWDFLKSKGLNPQAYKGFGDSIGGDIKYSKLSPNQKRQRKYGKVYQPQLEPGEVMPASLRFGKANWPKGFDVEKDITIILDAIGKDQYEVTKAFQKILSSAQVPSYMKITPDLESHRWFVGFDYETSDPADEYAARRKSIETFKDQNRKKWTDAIQKLSAGRTNPAQLAPLVRSWLVTKHNFQRPFHVDILPQEEFDRAIDVINKSNLADLVDFAKESGALPPVVGEDPTIPVGRQRQEAIMTKRWTQIINRLASESDVEPAYIEVALSNYLSQKGFDDPFEFDTATPSMQARAITAVMSLTFNDISDLLESVQKQVRSLMG